MAQGRTGFLTPRDREILEDFFFCRYLTTNQIAYLHFNSVSRCSARLNELKNIKGCLASRVVYTIAPTRDHPGKWETVWHLTKDAFEMMADSLGSEQRWAPKPLAEDKTRDHIRANEVYVQAKGLLDDMLGPYPQWEWYHEKRAFDEYQLGGENYKHRPDAHVIFRDNLFVLERQTKESNVTSEEIYDKVASTRTYIKAQRIDGIEDTDLLFACEGRRVVEAAERAGKQYGVYVVAGSTYEIAEYLHNSAMRLQ